MMDQKTEARNTETEMTVESAWAELDHLRPCSGYLELLVDKSKGQYAVTWVRPVLINNVPCKVHWKQASGARLSECLAQVRKWKEA